jgi:uncharacterized protein YbjT (DUF2867 family)
MNVLVIGATGLIGGAVAARLAADGHVVNGVARDVVAARRRRPDMQWFRVDLAEARADDWGPALFGVEVVVNCAGTLQDGPADSTKGVHADGVAALIEACRIASVRRFVHFSAIGVDRETPSPFSQTKRRGEEAVMASGLEWVILRPSVVVGRAAYGGSALFRGLAALPILPVMSNTGPIQVVQRDEVVETVARLVQPGAPAGLALDLAGPERLSFTDIVRAYRAWLGWSKPRTVAAPGWAAAALYRLGDVVGALGWRPPVRSTARLEIVRGAVGDNAEWRRVTGIEPRSLAAALACEPASVQERWFAWLYILKPLIIAVLAVFWIGTGLISLGPGWPIGMSLMLEGGAGALSAPVIVAGALADILIGIGILFRRTARPAIYAALVISVVYAIVGTVMLPRLWADPLGPMWKIMPIIVFHLAALATLEDR